MPGFQPQLTNSAMLSAPVHAVNFSCRVNVGVGANSAVVGFVVNGIPGSTEQVLIRVSGPSLAQFGVAGTLAQPVLTLFDAKGATIATNASWSTSASAADIATAGAAVGAFALGAAAADSALLVNLAPGVYTSQVTGGNSTTGIALVEVYEVP